MKIKLSCYSHAIGSYSRYPWAPAYCLNGSSATLIAYSPATTVIHRLSSRHRWTFSSASSYCTCSLVLFSKYQSVPPHFRGRGTKRQALHVINATLYRGELKGLGTGSWGDDCWKDANTHSAFQIADSACRKLVSRTCSAIHGDSDGSNGSWLRWAHRKD